MNWVERNYPIGAEILAPHPQLVEWQKCQITDHIVGPPAPGSPARRITGIMICHPDGIYQEIDGSLLNEDGSGI